jgi:hypothetical protein
MDPVPTRSHLYRVIIPEAIDAAMEGFDFDGRVERYAALLLQRATNLAGTDGHLALVAASQVLHHAPNLTVASQQFVPMTLSRGDSLLGELGTVFILTQGAAVLTGSAAVDTGSGTEVRAGASIRARSRYVALESGVGVTAVSDTATVLVRGTRTVRPAYRPLYTAYADKLYAWELFRGTNLGYELDRPATRLEGLILLIRILGGEAAALAFSPEHIYPDVPVWGNQQADRFVAYGLHIGVTRGSTRATCTRPSCCAPWDTTTPPGTLCGAAPWISRCRSAWCRRTRCAECGPCLCATIWSICPTVPFTPTSGGQT